jgi:hypothetical protein
MDDGRKCFPVEPPVTVFIVELELVLHLPKILKNGKWSSIVNIVEL